MPTDEICIVTPRLDDNSLGRSYCIWELCQSLQLPTRVISPTRAAAIWAPLRDTDFGRACEAVDPRAEADVLKRTLRTAELVIIVKPIVDSFGQVYRLLDNATPVIVDIDDPDIEGSTRWLPPRARLRASASSTYWRLKHYRTLLDKYTLTVSNPVLQSLYGGHLVPHVRHDTGFGSPHQSSNPSVAFIGTPRPHKGIDVLRTAVGNLASAGYTLDVTAPAPDDARPWERWHGHTSIEQGLALTASADIVAIPSLAQGYARAQFPVKVVDAMLAGRAIAASNLTPLEWAIGEGGEFCQAGDVSALTDVLWQLRDPGLRMKLGSAGRRRATENFTVDAVLPSFKQAMNAALQN